jgi:hypothetical protein
MSLRAVTVRLRNLEARRLQPSIHPQWAVYKADHVLDHVLMTDGSRLTGQEALSRLNADQGNMPIKAYVGFDPNTCVSSKVS